MDTPFELVVGNGPHAGHRIPLEGGLTVGRQADNQLSLDDAQLSRRHARFDCSGGTLTVTDLGSANGTTVNGLPITGAHELHPGDRVQVGDTILQVEGAAFQQTQIATSPPPNFAPAPGNSFPPYSVPAPAPGNSRPRSQSGSRLPLIIGGIVGVVLLLCVCGGVGTALFLRAAASPGTSTTGSTSGGGSSSSGGGSTGSGATGGGVSTGGGSGAAGGQQAPASGRYECYFFTGGRLEARPGLNFTITGPGRYADSTGQSGTYAYDAETQIVTFRSAALNGQRALYNDRETPRTLAFLNAQNEQRDTCDHTP